MGNSSWLPESFDSGCDWFRLGTIRTFPWTVKGVFLISSRNIRSIVERFAS